MKITNKQLRQIIKEELEIVVNEGLPAFAALKTALGRGDNNASSSPTKYKLTDHQKMINAGKRIKEETGVEIWVREGKYNTFRFHIGSRDSYDRVHAKEGLTEEEYYNQIMQKIKGMKVGGYGSEVSLDDPTME